MKKYIPLVIAILGGLLFLAVKSVQAFKPVNEVISVITATDEEIIEDVIAVIEEETGSPPPLEPPKPAAKVLKNTIIPHTIQGCKACILDKRFVFPAYIRAGWTIKASVDETEAPKKPRYPWYEIYDKDGNRKEFIGSLNTYKQ